MADKGRGDFFAIDARAWQAVCKLGLNEAVAYLVLARGSGADQRTTFWSINSLEQYTGVSRPRGHVAIGRLVEANLIRRDRGGSRPRYFILPVDPEAAASPEWIWLPNSIIDGAAYEQRPVELLRQTQKVAILRLFIELYASHNLQSDGGLHWRIIRQEWERHKAGENGQTVVWAFFAGDTTAWRKTFVQRFLTGKMVTHEGRRRDEGWQAFWEAWGVLRNLGLIAFVPHVIEADTDTAEIIHPYGGIGSGKDIGRAAGVAGRAILLTTNSRKCHEWAARDDCCLLPAFAHQKDVQIVGIAQLTYRPRTGATAAWRDRIGDWSSWVDRYDAIAKTGEMQHQGTSM